MVIGLGYLDSQMQRGDMPAALNTDVDILIPEKPKFNQTFLLMSLNNTVDTKTEMNTDES